MIQTWVEPEPPPWVTVTAGGSSRRDRAPAPARRVALQIAAAAVAVLMIVGLGGVFVVRRIAEREAMNGASQLTDLLATTVIMPALDDGLLTGDPAARERLATAITEQKVLEGDFTRIKVWSPTGTILYSDAAPLVGERYQLGEEELEVLRAPATVAEVSDLSRPENRLERGQGPMVEVYRPVWTASGKPMLFETYRRYTTVTARTGDLWRAFGGIVVSSLLLFLVLLMPLLWALLDRLRRARDQREMLLQHAIDASEDERRRIAADLHDGVVQELVAASLAVSGAAEQLAGDTSTPATVGRAAQVAQLRAAAAAVRGTVGGLRSLLVDIYPQNLTGAGLGPALDDLATGLRGRGVVVDVDVDPVAAADLPPEQQRLVYRFVRECLRNVAKHARAGSARVVLSRRHDGTTVEVADDGVGLDPAVAAAARTQGHVGLRLLADLAQEHDATLLMATAPSRGTRWRLQLPPSTEGDRP